MENTAVRLDLYILRFLYSCILSTIYSDALASFGIQIPIIMLVVAVPDDLITSASSSMQFPKDEQAHANGEHENVCSDMISQEDTTLLKYSEVMDTKKDAKLIRIDISFKSPSHTGLQTTKLVFDSAGIEPSRF